MAYRDNKVYDFRLVKSNANQSLTIDLGKEFSGTVTAFMKQDAASTHYKEFTVTDGRYISLTQSQTKDVEEDGETIEIAGVWYVNVWQVADGDDDNEKQLIYTGRIYFIPQIDDYEEETIYFFQFDDTSLGFDDIDQIDDTFLETYGTQYETSDMTDGQNITLSYVGKYGFIIQKSTEPSYAIYDALGSDITDEFDYVYQDSAAYFVSQEIAIPSTIYFKFV